MEIENIHCPQVPVGVCYKENIKDYLVLWQKFLKFWDNLLKAIAHNFRDLWIL
jgi:hypothetical protein